jgi:hypothetical protein
MIDLTKPGETWDVIYYTLYALPIHSIVQVFFGGVLFFSFPYITIIAVLTVFASLSQVPLIRRGFAAKGVSCFVAVVLF